MNWVVVDDEIIRESQLCSESGGEEEKGVQSK